MNETIKENSMKKKLIVVLLGLLISTIVFTAYFATPMVHAEQNDGIFGKCCPEAGSVCVIYQLVKMDHYYLSKGECAQGN
jgi:hypothetical protein